MIKPFPASEVSIVNVAGVLATLPCDIIPGPYADILDQNRYSTVTKYFLYFLKTKVTLTYSIFVLHVMDYQIVI